MADAKEMTGRHTLAIMSIVSILRNNNIFTVEQAQDVLRTLLKEKYDEC